MDKMIVNLMQFMGYVMGGFIMCYYGKILTDGINSIGVAVYASKWYLSEPKMVRDVKLILLRCQKPIVLDVFLIGSFSFPMFVLVVKTSFSYYTILRQKI